MPEIVRVRLSQDDNDLRALVPLHKQAKNERNHFHALIIGLGKIETVSRALTVLFSTLTRRTNFQLVGSIDSLEARGAYDRAKSKGVRFSRDLAAVQA